MVLRNQSAMPLANALGIVETGNAKQNTGRITGCRVIVFPALPKQSPRHPAIPRGGNHNCAEPEQKAPACGQKGAANPKQYWQQLLRLKLFHPHRPRQRGDNQEPKKGH
jgi:hypothetical protein